MSPIILKNCKLDTYDAHQFIGMTLIVSNDPVETAKYYFSDYIKDLPTASSLIKNYKTMTDIVNDKLKKVEINIFLKFFSILKTEIKIYSEINTFIFIIKFYKDF